MIPKLIARMKTRRKFDIDVGQDKPTFAFWGSRLIVQPDADTNCPSAPDGYRLVPDRSALEFVQHTLVQL